MSTTITPNPQNALRAQQFLKNESLRSMYNENDDNTIVLYLQNATATISSFTSEPETFTF